MYKIFDKVINFIMKAIANWKVKLAAGEQTLAVGKIQRGNFQVDSLSPLLFIITLMPVNNVIRKYSGPTNLQN